MQHTPHPGASANLTAQPWSYKYDRGIRLDRLWPTPPFSHHFTLFIKLTSYPATTFFNYCKTKNFRIGYGIHYREHLKIQGQHAAHRLVERIDERNKIHLDLLRLCTILPRRIAILLRLPDSHVAFDAEPDTFNNS